MHLYWKRHQLSVIEYKERKIKGIYSSLRTLVLNNKTVTKSDISKRFFFFLLQGQRAL